MFNNQYLYERPMSIRLDRTDKDPLARLPDGLKSIGMGLGPGGAPLNDVESIYNIFFFIALPFISTIKKSIFIRI